MIEDVGAAWTGAGSASASGSGTRGWQRALGTAAELVALPAEQAVRLPEGTSFAEGACFGIPADDGVVRGDGRTAGGGADGAV